MNKICNLIALSLFLWSGVNAQKINLNEPVKYIGNDGTSNSDYKTGYHDGQVKPAIGVQNYQIMRANRSYPYLSDGLGWTYNHAPNMAYWNNTFYCQYLSNPFGEHVVPGLTLLTSSADGKNWSLPKVVFPIYFTADSTAKIENHYMHQRQGFYVAPDGRMLIMGFYGGPYGEGIGRVVREMYKNNEFGPIYFIKMNKKWKGEVKYPMYDKSPDKGFVDACDAFLADKVRRMQWCEENRHADDVDDFFRVPLLKSGDKRVPGQAFCFYTLPDETIIGMFKKRWVTVSSDGGNSWSEPARCKTLTYGGAKVWGQRLDNGRYALVYNPTDGNAREPLSITTSNDGINFDNLLNIHGEVPTKRFWGMEKRPGPQYVRGIVEGNGNPPGDDLWVVYSVNKEDIWISRIPVPVKGEVNEPVNDNFDKMEIGGVVKDWNIYSPQWCPVEVTKSPDNSGNALMLKDFAPYDYAKAVRVFQKNGKNTIRFQLYVTANPETLGIEVVTAKGTRCIQTELDTKANILAKNGTDALTNISDLKKGEWVPIEISFNSEKGLFSVKQEGKVIAKNFSFAEPGEPERIIFRTGKYRLTDDVQKFKSGGKHIPGWDEPGCDEKITPALYYLKDFRVDGE